MIAADELAILTLVSLRAILDDRAGVAVACRMHSERLKDAFRDEAPVTRSRCLLDDVTEKVVVDVPVAVGFAGRKARPVPRQYV